MPKRSPSNSSSSSNNSEEYRRLSAKLLRKMQSQKQNTDPLALNYQKLTASRDKNSHTLKQEREEAREVRRSRSRSREAHRQVPLEVRWHIYELCPLPELEKRIPAEILKLPIFRKKQEIITAIVQNQIVLITGETGCGKSTQVPRLIYQYLRNARVNEKILCVQPRRLAVINLHSILSRQMSDQNVIGYQIGRQAYLHAGSKIVFMTNGIFLQRLVLNPSFLEEYKFIILDEVHERDIDTDFILLSIKRVIRSYPRQRVILMSATIDNQLFRYYFARDHIDKFLSNPNYYKQMLAKQQDSDDEREHSTVQTMEFMRAQYPCPAINITEAGNFTREYFYLDTINQFLTRKACLRWGNVIFSEKYPASNKELYQAVTLIIDQILYKQGEDKRSSILVFLPGLAEIQSLNSQLYTFFGQTRVQNDFDVLLVHSSILNEEITRKLHSEPSRSLRIILSTNISESSITVLGVNYIIDFCLSKQVRFDRRSRMQNLQLVWASKASCQQRAGRTGRVCNGTVFRLVQKKFYDKLPEYSTPEIQRSSLDKVVLRIKLMHQTEKSNLFQDPGDVLGSAIQPPELKSIDSAIKSLLFCGGLEMRPILTPALEGGQRQANYSFEITKLGRLYVEMPIDIAYCKALLISLLFGTYENTLILVSILSQSKNAFRRNAIDRNYLQFYQLIDNPFSCDFQSLIAAYHARQQKNDNRRSGGAELQVYTEAKQLARDLDKRLKDKQIIPLYADWLSKCNSWSKQVQKDSTSEWKRWNAAESKQHKKIIELQQTTHRYFTNRQFEEHFRFQMTLVCSFIDKLLKVQRPAYDNRQQKRLKCMKMQGISNVNTVCVLNSDILRKPDNSSPEAEYRLKKVWLGHLQKNLKISNANITLIYGGCYIHFANQRDLKKFMFAKFAEDGKNKDSKTETDKQVTLGSATFVSTKEMLRYFGDIDHMQKGRPCTFSREQFVTIDNYSLNRVINVNEGEQPKLLICNTLIQQSGRLLVRFASQLPSVPHLDVALHLIFYPFVVLVRSPNLSYFAYIQLCRKVRISIEHELTSFEIKMANHIRGQLRSFLNMDEIGIDSPSFVQSVLQFVFLARKTVKNQQRWQQIYVQQVIDRKHNIQSQLYRLVELIEIKKSQRMEHKGKQRETKDADTPGRVFMNDIEFDNLAVGYFSSQTINNISFHTRNADYLAWKQKKLKEIRSISDTAMNHDVYLVCGQESCGLRIAKLKRVGCVTQEIFRDLFEHESQNVIELKFNEINSYFCSLLMSNCIEKEFNCFGCLKGHYIGIKLEGETKIKIVPFSPLIIMYTDGSVEKADFDRLDLVYWRKKADEAYARKMRMDINTHCFVCDDTFNTISKLENHLKDQLHLQNLADFEQTFVPETKFECLPQM